MEKVEDLGLQPFEAPDPLPPLEAEDEIKLVCWMVIAPEDADIDDEDRPGLMSQMSIDSFGP